MFDFLNNLEKPTNWLQLIFYCVIIICATTYAIYRLRTDKKNGGNWRKVLHKIDNKLDLHITNSDKRHEDTQKQIKEIKKRLK